MFIKYFGVITFKLQMLNLNIKQDHSLVQSPLVSARSIHWFLQGAVTKMALAIAGKLHLTFSSRKEVNLEEKI